MPDLAQLQAQDEAWGKQYDQEQQQAEQQKQQSQGEPSFLQRWTAPIGRVALPVLDDAVSAAETMYSQGVRKARDVGAGVVTAAANTADAAHSLARATEQNFTDLANPDFHPGTGQPANVLHAPSPIWDHAKSAVLDFRDAVAVKDPDLSDSLTQSAAQLAIPFLGYSRALAGLHGFANMVAADAATNATALGPHDPRLADLVAVGRQTEGKLGEALRKLAPDGSALNAYINYLTDRSNETEAEGRFKNVLDGFGATLLATPLFHSAAVVLKQGARGLRYALEQGAQTFSDLGAKPLPQTDKEIADDVLSRAAARARNLPDLTAPAQKPSLQHTHDESTGAHFVQSENGYTKAQSAGKDIVVSTTHTRAAARGKGEGVKRMEFLARQAHGRGGLLRSDVSVSPDQARIYDKLAEKGYAVEKNPNATKSEITGNWLSDDPRRSVYTIGPRILAAGQVR